jgi:hypothetical protein
VRRQLFALDRRNHRALSNPRRATQRLEACLPEACRRAPRHTAGSRRARGMDVRGCSSLILPPCAP